MLSVVVAVFAVLWLPYRGMLVYNSFATMFNRPPFMDLWFLMFAKTCVYINRLYGAGKRKVEVIWVHRSLRGSINDLRIPKLGSAPMWHHKLTPVKSVTSPTPHI
ncbi:hypothetical protein AAG570_001143 [Ranatra chinensis]|uniref:Uncharacterized protein n=1 Tax=Ranatra chinensis TaxID=642074 RepID=A0ABD0YBA0_9HEMI